MVFVVVERKKEGIVDWIEVATKGYDIGEEFGLWKKLRSTLRRRKKILVLGASGAGKTQFVNSLISLLSERLSGRQRTISVQRRKVLVDEYPFLLLDTPGQQGDEAKRKPEITNVLRSPIEGLINVACFGYHEAAEAGSADALPKSGRGIASADYLDRRRNVELGLLSEWVPLLDATAVRWVLTVVTKADLWWPEVSESRHTTSEAHTLITWTNSRTFTLSFLIVQ
jgi:energy-coupling factor transporter ATP-binding protein EcfA2